MYDAVVTSPADWVALKPPVIVDPMIYRLGEMFLAGNPTRDVDTSDGCWKPISQDVGGLVSFFDLLVLYDKLPAFNYADTFDSQLNFADQLQALVNNQLKVIQHVDVSYNAYMASKDAALRALTERIQNNHGTLVPRTLAADLRSELTTLEYKWTPSLGELEDGLDDETRMVARFLLGTLVFSTYAQQSGAPQILSAKRSRLFTASSLAAPHSGADVEDALYDELRRRFSTTGTQWRDRQAPWTPSFLPWILSEIDPVRTRPVDLLERVFELRGRGVVAEYRETRTRALAGDPDATAALSDLADSMTEALRTNRAELSPTRTVLVEIFPKVFGAAAGALAGAPAGPLGTILGAALGTSAEEILRP